MKLSTIVFNAFFVTALGVSAATGVDGSKSAEQSFLKDSSDQRRSHKHKTSLRKGKIQLSADAKISIEEDLTLRALKNTAANLKDDLEASIIDSTEAVALHQRRLKYDGPSVLNHQPDANQQKFVADVVSIGSETRPDNLKAQMSTWASSHVSVRNFWGFTELQDFDSECSIMSEERMTAHIKTCKKKSSSSSLGFLDPIIEGFVQEYYGYSEGMKDRTKDVGWLCAQRRLGVAFGWLQSRYGSKVDDVEYSTLPDVLIFADDDTFLDVEKVKNYMVEESKHREGQPLACAACLFEENKANIPFSFPYGGFGTFLNKEALQKMTTPIVCSEEDRNRDKRICSSLKEDRIGETALFEEGMTILELFYKYSLLEVNCLHSDWILGFMIKYYLNPELEATRDDYQHQPEHLLLGMEIHPYCGNFTSISTRPCHGTKSVACHNQSPKDMESLALSSYVRAPDSFSSIPRIDATSVDDTMAMITQKEKDVAEGEETGKELLPNVLLIGAQKAGTTSIAKWLFSGGVCYAKTFPNEPSHYSKEVHFFDRDHRYNQGLEFYSKRFQHCMVDGDSKFIMDATPNYLGYPERVYNFYNQVGADALSKLKFIVILREPVSREMSLYNHKKVLYHKKLGRGEWYSDVAFANNNTVMPFEEYAKTVLQRRLSNPTVITTGKYVDHLKRWALLFERNQLLVLSYDELKEDPKKVQWRIEEFLGGSFPGGLDHLNAKKNDDKKKTVPLPISQLLNPVFKGKNLELYQFMDANPGPAMEQHPFPRFEKSPTSMTKFAYVTVFGWNSKDEAQNRLYREAVEVWIKFLEQSGTDADIVVLVINSDVQAEQLFKARGAIIKHIDPIKQPQIDEHFEPWFVDIAFAKLRAFELTEYERVQLMDVDIAIVKGKNLDALFLHAPSSNLVSEGLGCDSPLRAGWMLLKPSSDNFVKLKSLVESGNFDEQRGWDHLDLPVEYPGWTSSEETPDKKWGFYGSQLEQGLLYHYFYALPKRANPNTVDLLRLVDDQELNSYGLVHFYGDRKPWGDKNKELPEFVKSAQAHWHQVHRSLKSFSNNSLPKFSSPLTEVGVAEYKKRRILYGYYMTPTTSTTIATPVTTSTITTTTATTSTTTATAATTATTSTTTATAVTTSTTMATATTTTTTVPSVLKFESTGSFSSNAQSCSFENEGDFIKFYRGVETTLKEQACDANCKADVQVKVKKACGQSMEELPGSRRLQQSDDDYDVYYTITTTVVCETLGCASGNDIANANAIVDSIADSVRLSIQSGSFTSALASNPDVASVLQVAVLNCLVVWGTVSEATAVVVSDASNVTVLPPPGPVNNNLYYPDWQEHSGTCKNDGNAPLYMERVLGSYLFDTLEACCDDYYSGWNKQKCMNYKGSGLWFVDHILGKCRTDCEKDNGGTCGGIANTMSDELYTNSKDCCEAELWWVKSDWCEVESLEVQDCYCGTLKFYPGDKVCVKDCATSCSGGDKTCGGIVSTSDIKLYDSASACCTEHFAWIENDLCDARSNGIAIQKWWPDKSNSVCVKDSETRAENLSVSLYDTVKACCTKINWISEASCTAKSTGEALQGSGKYFVDWKNYKCAKECVGLPPCVGIASTGQLYDTADACCDKIQWVPRSECIVT